MFPEPLGGDWRISLPAPRHETRGFGRRGVCAIWHHAASAADKRTLCDAAKSFSSFGLHASAEWRRRRRRRPRKEGQQILFSPFHTRDSSHIQRAEYVCVCRPPEGHSKKRRGGRRRRGGHIRNMEGAAATVLQNGRRRRRRRRRRRLGRPPPLDWEWGQPPVHVHPSPQAGGKSRDIMTLL